MLNLTWKIRGEGTKIGSTYSVMCYPNLLFIDSDGKLVHRTAGAEQDPQYYITLGETAKNPEKCFSAVEAKYRANPSNPTNFKEYIGGCFNHLFGLCYRTG